MPRCSSRLYCVTGDPYHRRQHGQHRRLARPGHRRPPDLLVDTAGSVTLGGDLSNASTNALTFRWETGPLALDGTTPPEIEVAGRDLGPAPEGMIDNFAIGTLTIGTGSTPTIATLVDHHDNQQDGQSSCEALYVDTLIVREGATLDTAGCNLYYRNLAREGAIPALGDQVLNIADMDWNADGNVDLADYAAFSSCFDFLGPPPQPCLDRFDADHNQALNLADFAEFQRRFEES